MSDLIRRADALAVLNALSGVAKICGMQGHMPFVDEAVKVISALPAVQPVAWRWHWNGGDEPDVWAYTDTPKASDEHITAYPLYAALPAVQPDATIARLEASIRFLERRCVDPVPHGSRSPMEHERDAGDGK